MLAVGVVRTEPVSARTLINRNEFNILLFLESFKRAHKIDINIKFGAGPVQID